MFFRQKGNSEKSFYVYCRFSIRFLGVPLFGAKTGRHLHTQAESGAYLRDFSCVPRRCPYIYYIRKNPTVILYTCINRHAGTQNRGKQIKD